MFGLKRLEVLLEMSRRFKKTPSGLAQVLEDEGHLSGGEHPLRHPVVGLSQGLGKLRVRLYPQRQAVQCRTLADIGGIRLCQFTLVIRADFHRF